MSANYNPGLHIVATFSSDIASLQNMQGCKMHYDGLIQELELNKIGEVYHSFDEGGFTSVVCLTESHISIHTWPEHGLATFDVFLSNFNRDNSTKARVIYERTLRYFNAQEITKTEITR
jgi:S-adenosylmethionine/arginine decarboxylase-like enzyme